MSDFDFWDEQEREDQEYDARQQEISDSYQQGLEEGKKISYNEGWNAAIKKVMSLMKGEKDEPENNA